jgi:hypothetical protein
MDLEHPPSLKRHHSALEEVDISRHPQDSLVYHCKTTSRVKVPESRPALFNKEVHQSDISQGWLFLFKARGKHLSIRRVVRPDHESPTVDQHLRAFGQGCLVNFDDYVVGKIVFFEHRGAGDVLASALIPLACGVIVQLFITHDGLLTDPKGRVANVQYILDIYEQVTLHGIEEVGAREDYRTITLVAHFGTSRLYQSEITVMADPGNAYYSTVLIPMKNLFSSQGVLKSIFRGLTANIPLPTLSNDPVDDPDEEFIETVKFIGCDLLCFLTFKQNSYEAKVLNFITGEILAKKTLPELNHQSFYEVRQYMLIVDLSYGVRSFHQKLRPVLKHRYHHSTFAKEQQLSVTLEARQRPGLTASIANSMASKALYPSSLQPIGRDPIKLPSAFNHDRNSIPKQQIDNLNLSRDNQLRRILSLVRGLQLSMDDSHPFPHSGPEERDLGHGFEQGWVPTSSCFC